MFFLLCLVFYLILNSGNPNGLSVNGDQSLKRWKQSLNICYEAYLTRKFKEEDVRSMHRCAMGRILEAVDKEAFFRVQTCSTFPLVANHQGSEIFSVICKGGKK